MKIQFASDLHIEFDQKPLRRNHLQKAEVLVLAGDIAGTPRELAGFIEKLAFPGRVLVVLGNHEFYHVTWDQGVDLYRDALSDLPSAFLLEADSLVLSGVRFLGCSLWTDFFDGEQGPASEGRERQEIPDEAEEGLADFRYIRWSRLGAPRSPDQMLHWEDVAERSKASQEWLKGELATPFAGQTVVITHHSPSILSNDPTYADSPIVGAFCNRLDEEISALGTQGPAAWIHGHCHNSSDYRIGQTRVLCNPAGYPFARNLDFEPDRLIEI